MPPSPQPPERNDPQRKLEQFRASFLSMTADGMYTHQRQQHLFQWCQHAGLNWDHARTYVTLEAAALFEHAVRRATTGPLLPADLAELQALKRRLALPDEYITPLTHAYDLVVQKLETTITAHKINLSAETALAELQNLIAAYPLPDSHQKRALAFLDRQHILARLNADLLPVAKSRATLYKDEICHLDVSVSFAARQPGKWYEYLRGRMVATNQRLMLLAPSGGFAQRWADPLALKLHDNLIELHAGTRSGALVCRDPQYVATLLLAAQRKYHSTYP